MAAVSIPQAADLSVRPTNFSVPIHKQNHQAVAESQHFTEHISEKSLAVATNEIMLTHSSSRPELSKRMPTQDSVHSFKSHHSGDTHLAPARVSALTRKDSNISDTASAPDSLLELYGTRTGGRNSMELDMRNGDLYSNEDDSERSRWIHRDKLARIESQELQAAGIILPRARPASKAGRVRDRSRDHYQNGSARSEQAARHEKIVESQIDEDEGKINANWDPRSPEEVAADRNYGSWKSEKGVSRLPLPKNSPLPIPHDYISRDTPVQRKQSGGWTGGEDQISYPKAARNESTPPEDAAIAISPKSNGADSSPTKKATATRKMSVASGNRSASNAARPKSRSGLNGKENSRPPTRSGEPGPSAKQPEGDPPWLATMYKPDPRLPPDQQLLPTVAKRLQQEQWEKEGKFGTAYDTQFRPMNEEQFHERPNSQIILDPIETEKPQENNWPLLEQAKSPTLSTGRPGTAGGYSTMPKIKDTAPPPSPKPILALQPQRQPLEVQEPPQKKRSGGCGCCTVM